VEPDEPNEQKAAPIRSLVDRFGAKGVAAGVGAVFVVLSAILFVAVGSDDPPISVPTTAVPQAAPTSTSRDGPQVAPIDTCTLIPDDDVDEALGLVDEDGGFRSGGMLVFEFGETCRWEAEIDETGTEVSMELGPGDESDFAPDTEIDGVTSTTYPSVGDLAVWYPGDGTGTMSAVEETEDGLLFVRLSINRPEVRLSHARC
jgi:hypothetical protein